MKMRSVCICGKPLHGVIWKQKKPKRDPAYLYMPYRITATCLFLAGAITMNAVVLVMAYMTLSIAGAIRDKK